MGQITRGQFERIVHDFRKFADERVRVEFNEGVFRVTGTETGIKKIQDMYRYAPDELMNCGVLDEGGSWYFTININNFSGFFESE